MKLLKREIIKKENNDGSYSMYLTVPIEVDSDKEFPETLSTKIRAFVINLLSKLI